MSSGATVTDSPAGEYAASAAATTSAGSVSRYRMNHRIASDGSMPGSSAGRVSTSTPSMGPKVQLNAVRASSRSTPPTARSVEQHRPLSGVHARCAVLDSRPPRTEPGHLSGRAPTTAFRSTRPNSRPAPQRPGPAATSGQRCGPRRHRPADRLTVGRDVPPAEIAGVTGLCPHGQRARPRSAWSGAVGVERGQLARAQRGTDPACGVAHVGGRHRGTCSPARRWSRRSLRRHWSPPPPLRPRRRPRHRSRLHRCRSPRRWPAGRRCRCR